MSCNSSKRMLEPFGPSLYLADGPTVPFFGFPYPTRMALARLAAHGECAQSGVTEIIARALRWI